MTITFQINYRTEYGQTLCVVETGESISGWTEQHPLQLQCQGTDFWTATVQVSDFLTELEYKYAIRVDGGYIYEAGDARRITLRHEEKNLTVRDFWQAQDADTPFRTTAFRKALFRRQETKNGARRKKEGNLRFSIDVPQVLPTQGVAVMGNIPELGEWNPAKKLVMSDADFPVWRASAEVKKEGVIEYKYCLYDLATGQVTDMEWGENRQIWGWQKGMHLQQNDRVFRRTKPRFRGAGVAVPVFSLRTEQDFGIGEFLDLKLMADWAARTGQKMIQTLPINDTTLTHTNTDSYPYNAVSVFALHPIYLNIPTMGKLTPAQKKKYEAKKQEFNAKDFADYQTVYDEKMTWFKALYKRDFKALSQTEDYKRFYERNSEWLEPYAKFLAERDGEPQDFYCYLQYHADKQLQEAVDYAHSQGVAMKGDIPIGISPDSVDAKTDPQLFHLDASAGAPPDDFSISGQNWGFPTYNWDVMAQDGFRWWRRRFTKMQDYFDAYRIDHILGFFRIWQMRKTDVWGLCGHFSPAMPYSLQDLWNMGVKLDEDRMTRPYIRSNFLGDVFGYDTEEAKERFLNTRDGYVYWFKDEFDTQKKVQEWFESRNLTDDKSRNLMNGLLYLHCEVLFVRDQEHPELLHPRISMYQSHTFNELYDDQRQVLMNIYNDYFYRRHTQFWRDSAMRKLPTLIHSTGMLCCGEDLGMVPACVPDVMHELQILSLEIQRMPKDPNRMFAHPADAPYLSVCTTGTHDMNPLRAWWEEDREVTQRFYNEQMGWWGEAPREMTPEIAEAIINQHVYSPAMWVILPLQDWLAIDSRLRRPDAHAERINVPANPRHFWNWRMHLNIEDLLKEDAFNDRVLAFTKVR
ncbi:MAG: 4-alpha-glucanotransferase [Paludibacteraceae bacterium]|nr:4-alpha-glucanotransferase [Paludibacteraceae bacterium]